MERARASGADMAALEARLAAADFSSQAAVEALPLAERWIVSRLHQVDHGCLLVSGQSGRVLWQGREGGWEGGDGGAGWAGKKVMWGGSFAACCRMCVKLVADGGDRGGPNGCDDGDNDVVDEVCERHDKYDFNLAGVATYNFFWDEFADW
ncbi:uncharacterized protein HaLaN_01058 [Haematococcus lacustris]|uniref:Uncharacterized protein n=1 Tax=Haematococcus lacustris TaxID=44745 RepID=A0A699YF25_HAELA|nr:uncharacterized protein HaLaN_01058 [Haematococcus lacustris]